jgi:hypothetical protein
MIAPGIDDRMNDERMIESIIRSVDHPLIGRIIERLR